MRPLFFQQSCAHSVENSGEPFERVPVAMLCGRGHALLQGASRHPFREHHVVIAVAGIGERGYAHLLLVIPARRYEGRAASGQVAVDRGQVRIALAEASQTHCLACRLFGADTKNCGAVTAPQFYFSVDVSAHLLYFDAAKQLRRPFERGPVFGNGRESGVHLRSRRPVRRSSLCSVG